MARTQNLSSPQRMQKNPVDSLDRIALSLTKIQEANPRFQMKMIHKLRKDLSSQIDTLRISPERQSYYLHQILNAHTIEEISALMIEIISKLPYKADDLH
jgi:hypothetical protein